MHTLDGKNNKISLFWTRLLSNSQSLTHFYFGGEDVRVSSSGTHPRCYSIFRCSYP